MIATDLWQISAWAIALVLVIVILIEHRRSVPNLALLYAPPPRQEIIVALLIIGVGLVLRISFLDEFQGGRLTSDENLTSVVYTSAIAHGEPTNNGATHLAYALALDLWYQVFGFTPIVARALSATLGIISLTFFFFGLRSVAGVRLALWSAAFLSVSLHGVHFSKLALEMGWLLFIPPIVFFFLITASQKRSPALAAIAGLVFSLGMFSYPGFLLAAASIIVGMVVGYIVRRTGAEPFNWKNRHLLIMVLAFLAGSFPFTAFAVYQHLTVFGAANLFRGGGGVTLSMAAALAGWSQLAHDGFVSSDSWYLMHRGMAFFSITLLPLALYGVFLFWRAKWQWYWYGFFLAILICIAIVPFTGAYPGMRRALFTLLPYSVAIGGGLIFLLNAMAARARTIPKMTESMLPRLLFKLLPLGILALAVAHPIAYQLTTGRDTVKWNRGDGFVLARIPFDFILSTLKSHDIVLDRKEFTGMFDGLLYTAYPQLYGRYNQESGIRHRVMFASAPIDSLSRDEVAKLPNKILITGDAGTFAHLVATAEICVSPDSMSSANAHLPYWGIFQTPDRQEHVIFDFESGSYSGWKVTGTAFGSAPATGTFPNQAVVANYRGQRLINSYLNGSDVDTGKIISPTFKITDDYLSLLVGGGKDRDKLKVELLVGDRVVQSATGDRLETLRTVRWDVQPYRGKLATIVITDAASGWWDHILVDHIVGESNARRCLNSFALPSTVGSEMSMAYDKHKRLEHQLHCDDSSQCRSDHPGFISTKGGDVTFLLKPKLRAAPTVLRLEVIRPSPEQESLIFVNNIPVGILTQTVLDATGMFADFIIPSQASNTSGNWIIRISPSTDPGKLGWDIVNASLHGQ